MNTLIDVAMLFGIACFIALFLGAICKAIKYILENIFKIDIVAWLTSDDEN